MTGIEQPRRRGHRSGARRGVAAIETALVLMLFFSLVFGMLDLGLAVFRYHVLAHAARDVARQAIVRGSMAPPQLDSWGPETYTGQADADHPIAEATRRVLGGLDPADVEILVEWPTGSNVFNDPYNNPVRVVLAAEHQPMVLFLFQQTITLRAESTMIIAH